MSSFVISKKEYIKAAGLMYGIESAKRDKHQYFLDHVYENFVECYEMNVTSVNEQYGAKDESDGAAYTYVFEEYAEKGKKIAEGSYEGMTLNQMRLNLWHFFRSIMYQIEEPSCSHAVGGFLFTCVSKLFEKDFRTINSTWWGDIEL